MSVFPPPHPPPSSSTYFWEFKDCPSSCALSPANGGVLPGSPPVAHMALDGPMSFEGHLSVDGRLEGPDVGVRSLDGVDRSGGYINGARDSGKTDQIENL